MGFGGRFLVRYRTAVKVTSEAGMKPGAKGQSKRVDTVGQFSVRVKDVCIGAKYFGVAVGRPKIDFNLLVGRGLASIRKINRTNRPPPRDRQELFYRLPDGKLVATPVRTNPSFTWGKAELVFGERIYHTRPVGRITIYLPTARAS